MGKVKRVALALALVGAVGSTLVGGASATHADDRGNQRGGTFLFGEPGVDRRAQPEPGRGACTAASAINTNPPQAAGDNAGDKPFERCFGDG